MTVITSSPCRERREREVGERRGGREGYKTQFVTKWMTINGGQKKGTFTEKRTKLTN